MPAPTRVVQMDPAHLVQVWLVAALAWALLSVFALYSGAARWLMVPPKLRYAGGLVLLCVSWLALVESRKVGINFLLSVMALVRLNYRVKTFMLEMTLAVS